MLCDLCGNREAQFKMLVEGSELSVCRNCKTAEAVELPQPRQLPVQTHVVVQDIVEIYPDYGKRIQAGRKERGIGRGDLAAKLGIKESFLQRIENQLIEPNEDLIPFIERTLGIKLRGKIEYKMGGAKQERPTTLGDIVELK